MEIPLIYYKKKDFPKRVNRDYFCDGKDLSKDQVVQIDNRLVIGLFYEGKLCTKSNIAKVDSHQVTGMFCEFRNNTLLDQLQTGFWEIYL